MKSGIPDPVRMAVITRDISRCLRCGQSVANIPSSVHHRLPRGRGGKATMANLALLCGSGTTGCHGDVESNRAQAYEDGWLVRTCGNPESVPVGTYYGWVYLTGAGPVIPVPVAAVTNGGQS